MKKVSMIVSAVFVMAAFVSCKKDYTCECSISASGQSGVTTQSVPLPNLTKKDAKSLCNQAEATYTGPGSSASCELK